MDALTKQQRQHRSPTLQDFSKYLETIGMNIVIETALGLGDDEVIEIRQGLEPGERVVIRGLETLTDGTSVRPSGA